MTIDLKTTNPLSFVEWKQYYNETLGSSELSVLYNNYLVDWKAVSYTHLRAHET